MNMPNADQLALIASAETALVAAAGRWEAAAVAPPWAYAVVASKFLAASSPHSLGLYCAAADQAAAFVEQTATGFAAVFRPRDVRVVEPVPTLTAPLHSGALRGVRYRDVMAADIVVHAGPQALAIEPRAGSHVVWIAPVAPPFIAALGRADAIFAAVGLRPGHLEAGLAAPWVRLTDIVAGHTDGRQLDEITVTWICTNPV